MTESTTAVRIFMLTLFPREGNGSATVVRDLATVLSPEMQVRVFYVDIDEAGIPGYETHFMKVDDFPVLRTHPRSRERRQFIGMTPAEIDQYVDQVHAEALEAVRDFQPDVIHVHHGWLGAAVAGRIRAETGIPFLVQFHGTELEVRHDYSSENASTLEYLDGVVNAGLNEAARFVTISPTEETRTSIYANGVGLEPRVEMIPNGYDESIFFPTTRDVEGLNKKYADRLGGSRLDADRPIVLYVGRFAGFKGIEYLVRAAAHYEKSGAQTLLCGDGELREGMMKLADDLGLMHTHFLGHVDHFDDLPGLYNAADVLVVPSKDEPFGLVAIEAMGCATPMIGSDSGALPYILGASARDEVVGKIKIAPLGLVVPFGDPEAIADAVVHAIEHRLKESDGERIAAQVRRDFSVTTQAKRYRDLYASLVR